MRTQQSTRYGYSRGSDGCDETFDIWDTHTCEVIDSVHFWDEEADAEEAARLIVWELNLNGPRHVRAFDDVA
jgi:hypothetical protein